MSEFKQLEKKRKKYCDKCKQPMQNAYLRHGKWVCWDCVKKFRLGEFKHG